MPANNNKALGPPRGRGRPRKDEVVAKPFISDNTPVLTRNGWKNHGDLVVGDEVIGLDGQFKKVTYQAE